MDIIDLASPVYSGNKWLLDQIRNKFNSGNNDNQLGTASNPSNYNSGPGPGGFGGPGEISGGGQVPLGSINLPYFQQDRDRLQGLLGGQSPFASADWGDLITQLKARANGTAPSLAQQNYQQASQNTINALGSMSRGSATPEAARDAIMQMGRVGQGQAAGLALAGTQEQNAAQGALTSALSQRDQINQGSYLNILGKQLGLSEGQLRALQGDQNFNIGVSGQDAQLQAARYQALAGLLGSVGKMAGGQ